MSRTKQCVKRGGGPRIHSRAARRATSPSINLDKSLKDASTLEPTPRPKPPILTPHYGGVSKKKPKQKRLSRAQRRRQQSGIERADINADTMEVKVQKSAGRHKTVKTRRADWEDLNGKIVAEEVQVPKVEETHKNLFKTLRQVDEENKMKPLPYSEQGATFQLPIFSKPQPTPSKAPAADDEEIL